MGVEIGEIKPLERSRSAFQRFYSIRLNDLIYVISRDLEYRRFLNLVFFTDSLDNFLDLFEFLLVKLSHFSFNLVYFLINLGDLLMFKILILFFEILQYTSDIVKTLLELQS